MSVRGKSRCRSPHLERENTNPLRRSHLSYDDITVRCIPSVDELIQYVLRDLGGLSAPGGSTDDDNRVIVNGGHDFFLKVLDRQLTSFT